MIGCRDQRVAESRELHGHLAIRRDGKIEWSEGSSRPQHSLEMTGDRWHSSGRRILEVVFASHV
jgi:hypothetical protein